MLRLCAASDVEILYQNFLNVRDQKQDSFRAGIVVTEA